MASIEISNSGKFVVRNKVNGKRKTFGSYVTKEDALNVISVLDYYNWDLTRKVYEYKGKYYVFIYWNNKFYNKGVYDTQEEAQKVASKPIMTYIKYRESYNTYEIIRDLKEGVINYGAYTTLDEAIHVRDKLIEHNWSKDYFQELYKTTSRQIDRYIYFEKGSYIIRKTFSTDNNDVQKNFGRFKTIEEARKQRDKIEKEGWNISTEKYIVVEDGKYKVIRSHVYGNVPYQDLYGVYDTKEEALKKQEELILKGFPESERVSSTNTMRYIHRTGTGYSIRRVIDTKRYYYGYYKKLEIAQIVRDYIEKHDWNIDTSIIEYDNKFYMLYRNSRYSYSYIGYVSSYDKAVEELYYYGC